MRLFKPFSLAEPTSPFNLSKIFWSISFCLNLILHVTLIKHKLWKSNLDQISHLKVYLLTYLMQNIQKLNMVDYTASNIWTKRYGGPCTFWQVFFFTNLIKLKKQFFCIFLHKIWTRWATKMCNTLKWSYEPKKFGC